MVIIANYLVDNILTRKRTIIRLLYQEENWEQEKKRQGSLRKEFFFFSVYHYDPCRRLACSKGKKQEK